MGLGSTAELSRTRPRSPDRYPALTPGPRIRSSQLPRRCTRAGTVPGPGLSSGPAPLPRDPSPLPLRLLGWSGRLLETAAGVSPCRPERFGSPRAVGHLWPATGGTGTRTETGRVVGLGGPKSFVAVPDSHPDALNQSESKPLLKRIA